MLWSTSCNCICIDTATCFVSPDVTSRKSDKWRQQGYFIRQTRGEVNSTPLSDFMKDIIHFPKVITWIWTCLNKTARIFIDFSICIISLLSQDWWRWTCTIVAQMKSNSFLLCGQHSQTIQTVRWWKVNWSPSTVNLFLLDHDLTVQRAEELCGLKMFEVVNVSQGSNFSRICYLFWIWINT